MSPADRKALKAAIREDKKYLTFRRNIKSNPNLRLPFEDLHDELDSIHKSKASRVLRRGDAQFTQSVVDAMLIDGQNRSRCVEILSACLSVSQTFDDTLNQLRDYLIDTYYSRFSTGRSTKDERRQFMAQVLDPMYEYSRKTRLLETHAKYIIEDIDQWGYTYRNIIEGVKLMGRPNEV